ncbi:hypothetical protein BDV59DRAFT_186170 [Aspergillus ambiguus]|uniref:uncharacterized protein n=1 Tax=Aspergillus ambiguus TaxID=176160 RepID=UPI003CCD8E3B
MAGKENISRSRRFNNCKSIRQQQTHRRNSLPRKSFEYCQECDADVFIIIRLKSDGQILSFNPNTNGIYHESSW